MRAAMWWTVIGVSSALSAHVEAQVMVAPGPAAPVRVVAPNSQRITLHRVVVEGPRTYWTGRRADFFEPLCTAPCALTLPLGSYRFGVSSEGDEAQRVNRLIDITGPSTLHVEHESRDALRTTGWVIFGASALTALALALGMLAIDTSASDFEAQLWGFGGAAIGSVVLGGIISIPFVALQDHAVVSALP